MLAKKAFVYYIDHNIYARQKMHCCYDHGSTHSIHGRLHSVLYIYIYLKDHVRFEWNGHQIDEHIRDKIQCSNWLITNIAFSFPLALPQLSHRPTLVWHFKDEDGGTRKKNTHAHTHLQTQPKRQKKQNLFFICRMWDMSSGMSVIIYIFIRLYIYISI